MTRVKFLADSMPQALAAARRELGPNVRVVEASHRRAGGPWPFPRSVEVVIVAEAGRDAHDRAAHDPDARHHGARPSATATDVRLRLAARIGLAHAVSAAHFAASSAALEAGTAVAELRSAANHGTPCVVPAIVARLAMRLRAQGLPADMVDLVSQRVQQETAGEFDPSASDVRASFVRAIAGFIPVAAADDATPARAEGRPRLIAVVGATGVGKTTTVAKIAADCRVRLNLRVGMLAADSYRVGAVEQLAAYAQILGAPMRAVDSVSTLRAAMLDLSWCDVVLMDTAGRSHRDQARIGEIAAMLNAAVPDETHLVISGASAEASQAEATEAFKRARPTRVVLSKLDECESIAALVGTLRASACPASWFTTGQEVPEDIERASALTLAERAVAEAEQAP